MHALLGLMGRAVARHPGLLLALLVVVTVGLGGFATQLDVETDITEFAADTPMAQAFDDIEARFDGREAQIQVIIDAGRGGNVLSREGLAVAERVTEIAEELPEVASHLAPGGLTGPPVMSYALPFSARFAGFGTDTDELSEVFVASFVRDTLDDMGHRIQPLLSTDANFGEGQARAGLAVVTLDADTDEQARRDAGVALRDALAGEDFGWFEVLPFSFALLTEDIEAGLFEDLPLLLAVSFLLIIIILWLLFRRVLDVALGVLALGLAILWMSGVAAVLGPSFLGLTGDFSQIAVAVPVLLVGLGIDYTVHLLARYRENLAAGIAPPGAAEVAMRTVGIALVLATLTTVAGFLSNLATPLPPIADFGVFAAAGIVAAFFVTGLLVPGARSLVDRRRARRGDAAALAAPPGDGMEHLGGVLGRVADLASRAPVAVLGFAALLAGAGAVAAGELDTEFSQEEFIPADSHAAQLIDRMQTLFGGDVSERTLVLVEGPFDDPGLANAVLEARERMADTDDVVTAGGVAELSSAPTLVELIDEEADDARANLDAQLDFVADPDTAAATLPLPTIREPGDLPDGFLDDADEAAQGGVLPDDRAGLERRLPDGVTPTEALLRALPAADLDAEIRSGLAEAFRADVPADTDPQVLAAAAALEPSEIDRETLVALEFPVETLSQSALDLIDTADELRALGWDGRRFRDDADLDAIYAVVAREAPTQLDGVLSADRRSGLLSIATTAGQPRAEALGEALADDLAPVAALGATLVIASEPLLIEETLATLADAQTAAIVISLLAAALLIIGYYGVVHRRPALGAIAMVPSLLAVVLTLGTMWAIGLSYNALTATIASIAIGIGVPYGIHVTNRFVEERRDAPDAATGIRRTIVHTGAALAGSAITTASAFGVLGLSNLAPLRQFGIITAIMIVFALIAALLAETSCLVLWDRWHRRGETAPARTSDSASAVPAEVGPA